MTKKKDPKDLKKRGPKLKVLDEKQLDHVKRMGGLGMTHEQMAYYLKIAPSTFYEIMKRQPEISKIIKEGEAQFSNDLRNTARHRALNGSDTMLIFLLKTREGFRETIKVEQSVTFKTTIGSDGAIQRDKLDDDKVIDVIAEAADPD